MRGRTPPVACFARHGSVCATPLRADLRQQPASAQNRRFVGGAIGRRQKWNDAVTAQVLGGASAHAARHDCLAIAERADDAFVAVIWPVSCFVLLAALAQRVWGVGIIPNFPRYDPRFVNLENQKGRAPTEVAGNHHIVVGSNRNSHPHPQSVIAGDGSSSMGGRAG